MPSIQQITHPIQHWFRSPPLRPLTLALSFTLTLLLIILPALSQRPIELTFLMLAPETPGFLPLIEEFETQNPGIKLTMVEGPNSPNLVEDLTTSAFLLGSAPYDLIHMDVVWAPKFAAAGWLMDLSDRLSPTDLADYLTTGLESGRYEGGLYRVPWRSDAGLLYYRQDLLEPPDSPPPETFEQLSDIAQTLQEQDATDWGYLWQGKQYEGVAAMFVEVLAGFGGVWIDPETKAVGLDQPQAIAAVEYLISTINNGISPSGVTTYQEEETRRLFQNGRAAFMRNWPYAYPLLNADDSAVKGNVGIKPMVYAPGGESAACLGGWGWGIASTTPHPEEAWKVMQFFNNVETQRGYILQTGYLPSRRSLYRDPAIVEQYPYFPEMLEVLENAALRPPIAQYAQASDILQRYLSAAFSGRMSAESAMGSAARETRSLLGQTNPREVADGG
ncbi:MAG: ABC transporter substrate-binding protein [Leptolyngbyaceae cyanobacterium SL_7_1]|nr:ABC transporter substrate-binding protein [Leptolyngbyaceae cyanobacterium SL_7_1]